VGYGIRGAISGWVAANEAGFSCSAGDANAGQNPIWIVTNHGDCLPLDWVEIPRIASARWLAVAFLDKKKEERGRSLAPLW